MAKSKKAAFSVKVSTPQTDDDAPVSMQDFCRYLPQQSVYFFIPERKLWPASSVNAKLPPVPALTKSGKPKRDKKGKPVYIPATKLIDANCCVEQTTWHPSLPVFITDRLAVADGWVKKRGVMSFNQYIPPKIIPGDAGKAGLWLDHLRRIYPDDADHIIRWLAHLRQRPGVKINHALVLIGFPGIGKDTILDPMREAVGAGNLHTISPADLLEPFNDFAKSVLLRINEGRDLGNIDRFKFYDHAKGYIAAPPDVIRVNEKHLKEYYVLNCCGVVITTNYKTDGLYLPADDRRHYVAGSSCRKDDSIDRYCDELWGFYNNNDGRAHVVAYLDQVDLSNFNPKAPPLKTPAFWQIVGVNTAREDDEIADLIEALGNPDVITVERLLEKADADTAEWLADRKNHRTIPHRLDRRGYTSVRNPNNKSDGRWTVGGKNVVVYAKDSLSPDEQVKAVEKFIAAYRSTKDKNGSNLRLVKTDGGKD